VHSTMSVLVMEEIEEVGPLGLWDERAFLHAASGAPSGCDSPLLTYGTRSGQSDGSKGTPTSSSAASHIPFPAQSGRRERASGTTFLGPGMYSIRISIEENSSSQRRRRGARNFCVWR